MFWGFFFFQLGHGLFVTSGSEKRSKWTSGSACFKNCRIEWRWSCFAYFCVFLGIFFNLATRFMWSLCLQKKTFEMNFRICMIQKLPNRMVLALFCTLFHTRTREKEGLTCKKLTSKSVCVRNCRIEWWWCTFVHNFKCIRAFLLLFPKKKSLTTFPPPPETADSSHAICYFAYFAKGTCFFTLL